MGILLSLETFDKYNVALTHDNFSMGKIEDEKDDLFHSQRHKMFLGKRLLD